jgi:hypothetical protein
MFSKNFSVLLFFKKSNSLLCQDRNGFARTDDPARCYQPFSASLSPESGITSANDDDDASHVTSTDNVSRVTSFDDASRVTSFDDASRVTSFDEFSRATSVGVATVSADLHAKLEDVEDDDAASHSSDDTVFKSDGMASACSTPIGEGPESIL